MNRIPFSIAACAIFAAFIILVFLERWLPLRKSVEAKLRHTIRNLAIATLSAGAVQLAEQPLVQPLATWTHGKGMGLLLAVPLPPWIQVSAAILLLDYTLYLWHVLTHRVPFLWRFHKAHHVDLDLDASTGVRFHFGEMLLSIPWRATQILVIGVSPLALSIWQVGLLLEVMFHHSNVALPIAFERWLCRIVVTPRMHGIHHSIVPEEMNSNWSSGLTLWDRMHKTLLLNIPQHDVTIGIESHQKALEVTLPKVLAMPFRAQPDTMAPTSSRTATQTSASTLLP